MMTRTVGRRLGALAGIAILATALVVVPTDRASAQSSGSAPIFISFDEPQVVDGLSIRDEDIVLYRPGSDSWTMVFDGSDMGLGGNDVDAFHVADDGDSSTLDPIYLSIRRDMRLPGFGRIESSDVLRFDPRSLGRNTSGRFRRVLDGSEVGLERPSENIDALTFDSDGRMLLSTTGQFEVPASGGGILTGRDEDIVLAYDGAGGFTLGLDGASVGLTARGEDVWGLATTSGDGLTLITKRDFRAFGPDLRPTRGTQGDVLLLETDAVRSFFTVVADATPDGVESRADGISHPPTRSIDLPERVDVIFSIDLTGSMRNELGQIKSGMRGVINDIRAAAPDSDIKYALVSYMDYPGRFDSRPCGDSVYSDTYGSAASGDVPFRLDLALTDQTSDVVAGVRSLSLGFGEDGPESYGRVFWEIAQADTGAELGLRADATTLVINIGDHLPHDTNINEGVTGAGLTGDTGIDPGRNAAIDCGGDDIDFQDDALAGLIENDIRLYHLHSGSSAHEPYWKTWTRSTGGGFGRYTDAASLSTAVIDALTSDPLVGLPFSADDAPEGVVEESPN